jgi:chorismate dehydratase
LLEKKYGVKAELKRLHSGVNDYEGFDAVLLIGDEALRHEKIGLGKFELVYDLATEWYKWQKLPFVFAVWAVRKALPQESRDELASLIQNALVKGEVEFERISEAHAGRIGLTPAEATEYLQGFNYRMGEREWRAIEVFENLLTSVESEVGRS